MADETNTTQETTESSISQDTPVNMGSEPINTPSEPLESSIDRDTPLPLNNDNQGSNSPESPRENQDIPAENPPVEPNPEPIPEPVLTQEHGTAQIPPNEPLTSQPDPIKPEPVSVSNYGEAKAEPENINPVPVIIPNKNKVLELLNKAKFAIQSRKRKKLGKIMALFLRNSKITNDEVEKFLHVSDATAERYLNILEKENKIKQVGKTGHAVSYTKI